MDGAVDMRDKIKLHYLIGDVHKGGHDVHRIAKANYMLLQEAKVFDVLRVCDESTIGDITFDQYFEADLIKQADVFVFNCRGIYFEKNSTFYAIYIYCCYVNFNFCNRCRYN